MKKSTGLRPKTSPLVNLPTTATNSAVVLEFWGFLCSAFTCFHSRYYISWQLHHSQSRNELDFTACFLHSLINCKIHYWETQSKSRPYISPRGPRERVTGAGNWSCSLHGRTLPRERPNGPSPAFIPVLKRKGTNELEREEPLVF